MVSRISRDEIRRYTRPVSYTHLDVYKRQIPNLGLNDNSLKGLIKQTKDERFVYDTYRRCLLYTSRCV